MGVLNQIKTIADREGITITSLESLIKASKGVLSRALRNNTDIQCMWVSRIVENYPQYNCNWIITGKGDMLNVNESYQVVSEADHIYKLNKGCYLCSEKDKVIANQAERIQELKETISILRSK